MPNPHIPDPALRTGFQNVTNTRVFATLFWAVFAATLGVGLVVPLLPVYAHALGATGLAIGFIFGAFSLTRTTFLPFFGRWSDLKGRKPFIVAGLFAYSVVSVGFLLSKDVGVFILIRFLQGIASAMILPVAQAYIGEIAPEKKEGFFMGLFNLSLYAGLSLGPLVGGALNDWLGIRAAFLGMGAVSFFGFLLCLVFLPAAHEEQRGATAKQPARYGVILRNPSVGALFLFRLAYTTCIGIVWAFLPLHANTQFQLSSSAVGVLVMLGVLTSGLLQTPMGWLADRFNKRLFIVTGGLVTAGSLVFFNHAEGFWGLFGANALFGLGGGIAIPAVMAMTVIIGRETGAMGTIMGLLTMGHSLGMFTGPILAGFMVDTFELPFAFVAGSGIIAIGTVLTFLGTRGFGLPAAKDAAAKSGIPEQIDNRGGVI